MHKSLKSSKAQFFVISAVLVIASIFSVSLFLQSLSQPSLTLSSVKVELDYIPQIKDILCGIAKTRESLDESAFREHLEEAKQKLEKWFYEQGIKFDMDYAISSSEVWFQFNLTSPGFKSITEFRC